ncbi:hypothetical protein ACLI09_07580 [Flavobacterium sp. RHBU_24]|uniref:hypothetical protein n=1 Tax=Flavobacterium sp. RHBU_24 TaxID=3391185 RepID=UPI003985337F
MKPVRYLLMCLFMLLAGCSAGQFTAATPRRLEKALDKHYTVLVNSDTLVFDKILLDDKELQNVSINKSIKTIAVATNTQNRLISIGELKQRYRRDSADVAFVVFQGLVYATNEKTFFQQTLIGDTTLIKKEKISSVISCHLPKGDILIVQ